MNLIKETIEELKENHLTSDDVRWVGSKDGKYGMSWDSFKETFKNIEYDCGYGYQEVAKDLVVVGNGWWLERREYDGAESWSFKRLPVACENQLSFDKILGAWDTLREIQMEMEEEA